MPARASRDRKEDLHKGAAAGSVPVRTIVTKRIPRQPDHLREAAAVRERVSAGEYAEATKLALAACGADVFGFLIGVLDDREVARQWLYGFAASDRLYRASA